MIRYRPAPDIQVVSDLLDDMFDATHPPGYLVPHAGIYRCTACGRSVVADRNGQLPGQEGHRHEPGRWQLAVWCTGV